MSKKHLLATAAISAALLLGACSSSSQTDLDDQSGTTVARTKNAALPSKPLPGQKVPLEQRIPLAPSTLPLAPSTTLAPSITTSTATSISQTVTTPPTTVAPSTTIIDNTTASIPFKRPPKKTDPLRVPPVCNPINNPFSPGCIPVPSTIKKP